MTSGSAGMDLHACLERPSDRLVLEPGGRALVPTGLAIAIPVGFEGQVRARSGNAARSGIGVLNAPGTIDADYRGELKVILINLGDAPFEVTTGDRIAQLVISPVVMCDVEEVAELPDGGDRGQGGFGSTG